MKGSIVGAAGIIYGKAAIEGFEGTSGDVTANGNTIATTFGYPNATQANIENIVTGADGDFQFIKVIAATEETPGRDPVGDPNDPDYDPGADPVPATVAAVTFGVPNYTAQCVRYAQAADANTPATVTVGANDCVVTPPPSL